MTNTLNTPPRLGYELAMAALREEGIRTGATKPTDDRERKWAAEGNRPLSEFETLKQYLAEGGDL